MNAADSSIRNLDFWRSMESEDSSGLDDRIARYKQSALSQFPIESPKILKVVLDTNAIWGEICSRLERPEHNTWLTEVIRSGVVKFYIPHWALSEFENSNARRIANKLMMEIKLVNAVFHLFVGELIIANRYQYPIARYAPFGADIKDEPYASLARDIGAIGVMSNDNDLDEYPVLRLNTGEVLNFGRLARLIDTRISLRTFGIHTSLVGIKIAEVFLKQGKSIVSKVPPAALLLILSAVALGLRTERGRELAGKALTSVVKALSSSSEFIYGGIEFHNQCKDKEQEILKEISGSTK